MFENITGFFSSLIGKDHEVSQSCEQALKERLVSPFYGYFVLSWVLINWDFLYPGFFIDQEVLFNKTGLLRNEYILQKVLPISHSLEWLWLFIVYPFILTVIIFWLMPYISRIFYKKYIYNTIVLDKIRTEEITKKVKAESKLVEAEKDKFVAELDNKLKREEAQRLSPELIWKEDYEIFKNHKLFSKFQQILDSVYAHNGLVSVVEKYTEEVIFSVDHDILVYSHINELIEFINDHNSIISLTSKGKFFAKKYLDKGL